MKKKVLKIYKIIYEYTNKYVSNNESAYQSDVTTAAKEIVKLEPSML
jgi:hypothetical protein